LPNQNRLLRPSIFTSRFILPKFCGVPSRLIWIGW
jgi:hypothetical protein